MHSEMAGLKETMYAEACANEFQPQMIPSAVSCKQIPLMLIVVDHRKHSKVSIQRWNEL